MASRPEIDTFVFEITNALRGGLPEVTLRGRVDEDPKLRNGTDATYKFVAEASIGDRKISYEDPDGRIRIDHTDKNLERDQANYVDSCLRFIAQTIETKGQEAFRVIRKEDDLLVTRK